MWEVEYTHEFEEWWETLTVEQQEAIDDRTGDAAGRAWAGPEATSRRGHQELSTPEHEGAPSFEGRSPAHTLRIRPRRHAILLLGGDRSGEWESWYRTAIPEADDLYDTHLQELRDGGLIED